MGKGRRRASGRMVGWQDFYETLPGNIRQAVYSGFAVDGGEGLTVSLWADDASMIDAAYRAGHHRDQMDEQRQSNAFFDFSSFTRARILSSSGTWDGADPVAEMS